MTAGGFKAEIPREQLDILFAGCSCVDFSGLNTKQKALQAGGIDKHLDMSNIPREALEVKLDPEFVKDLDATIPMLNSKDHGESTQTFFGAIKLIISTRPKTVILENVDGAPWNAYRNVIFPLIGYAAEFMHLDSKKYYLPQTRQRGYLVAFNADNIGADAAMDIAKAWKKSMEQCQHPASAPVTSFLRSPDDPATIQARISIESKKLNNSLAELCMLRHDKIRAEHDIGANEHPHSMMVTGHGRINHSRFPSNGWQRHWKRQTLRIADAMDIAVAVPLKKFNIDIRYKPFLVDVSQNVDRIPIIAHSNGAIKNVGLIGCITPSGDPIITNLMRPVTGTEVMALQGMPIDDMTITTETQANLQDLAGNAMTVTVVGAAALSIIGVTSVEAPDYWESVDAALVNHIPGVYLDRSDHNLLVSAVEFPEFIMTGPFRELCDIAKRVRRVCFCAYTVTYQKESERTYFSCVNCGATACSVCRGNPAHSFEVDHSLGPELTSAEAKVKLSGILPPVFFLSTPSELIKRNFPSSLDEDNILYLEVVLGILEGARYYFQNIKCTEVVTVCYRSTHSLARLVLSENSASLYIFVAPDHHRREELIEFFDLEQPIARISLRVEKTDRMKWDLWVNGRIDLRLPVEMNETDDSFEFGQLNFVKLEGHLNPRFMSALRDNVQKHLEGKFHPKPNCGTARDALRVRKEAPRVFFMVHPTPHGDPQLDCFVFTLDARTMDPHEYREVLLNVSHEDKILDYKMWTVPLRTSEEKRLLNVFWRGYWSPCSLYGFTLNGIPSQISTSFGMSWPMEYSSCSQDASPVHTSTLAVVTAEVPDLPVSAMSLFRIDSSCIEQGSYFYTIPPTERDSFLKKVAAFAGLGVRLDVAPWSDSTGHLRGEWITVAPCDHCGPTPPAVIFYQRSIYEDPAEAEAYERQLLSQPKPISIGARYDSSGPTPLLEMVVRLHPSALPSRALGYLKQAHQSAVRGRRGLLSLVKTSVTVQLGHMWLRGAEFPPLGTALQPCSDENLAGIDIDALARLEEGQRAAVLNLPRFRRQGRSLLPGQTQAVRWMVWREEVPLPFTEYETEEDVVAGLNLRVVGKAQ